MRIKRGSEECGREREREREREDDDKMEMMVTTVTTTTLVLSCRAGPSLLGALSRISFKLFGPPLPSPLCLMIIDANGTLYVKMHEDPSPPSCAEVDVNGGVGRIWGSSSRTC